jgi:glycosyltransferase involved in cell wall biosynthesis
MSELISVVLPSYNRAGTLPRAVASVLQQDYRELELIVVDDASSDDSAQALAAIADPRLRTLRLARNSGPSAARNRGVEEARGEWVAFHDSDDEWLPGHLRRLAEAARQLGPDYGLLTCCTRCPEDDSFSYKVWPGRAAVSDAADLLLHSLPGTPTWLARRADLLRAGGFDAALRNFEDWELALRLSEFTRIGLVNEVLHLNHRTPGSLFSNEAAYVRALEAVLIRHRAKWARQPRDLAMYQAIIGHKAFLFGSRGEGRLWFCRAIATAPTAPRAWLSLGMSLLGRGAYRRVTEAVRLRRRARLAAAPGLR